MEIHSNAHNQCFGCQIINCPIVGEHVKSGGQWEKKSCQHVLHDRAQHGTEKFNLLIFNK